jgi:hypothetical protein
MPLAGLILNRVHRTPAAGLSAARSLAAAETLQTAGARADRGSGGGARSDGNGGNGGGESGASRLAIAALRLHAERMQLTASERRLAEHFTAAHPLVPVAEIPAQPDDVHDLAGLRAIGSAFSAS